MKKIGVLALQGDVREHLFAIENCGAIATEVKRPRDLENLDGLIIPGGESTTIVSLAKTFAIFEPIKKRIAAGMPTYGSCAGMIMLADHIVAAKEGQETFGGIEYPFWIRTQQLEGITEVGLRIEKKE